MCRLTALASSVEGRKLKIHPKMENGKLECPSPLCGCEEKSFHHRTGGKAEPAEQCFHDEHLEGGLEHGPWSQTDLLSSLTPVCTPLYSLLNFLI